MLHEIAARDYLHTGCATVGSSGRDRVRVMSSPICWPACLLPLVSGWSVNSSAGRLQPASTAARDACILGFDV